MITVGMDETNPRTLRERLQVFEWAQRGTCYAVELATVAEIAAWGGSTKARNGAAASAMRRAMDMVGRPSSFIVDGRPLPLPPDLQALSTIARATTRRSGGSES